MLEEMLNDLLTILWNMPHFNFTREKLVDFFDRTNQLSGKTTFANYQASHPTETEKVFWAWDRSNIEKYLLEWPNLCNALEDFIAAINLTWNELFQKSAACDDLLPLLIEIMPRDIAYLTKLLPLLSCAANINKNTMTDYYFTQLYSAVQFHLNYSLVQKSDGKPEEYLAVINRLRNANYFGSITILLKLNTIFKSNMISLAKQIYLLLDQHHNHEYDINPCIVVTDELIDAWSEQIYHMRTNRDEAPFANDSALSQLIEKFEIYMHLHIAITRTRSSAVHKLAEIVAKVRDNQPLIQTDLDSIEFVPCATICQYLKIPQKQGGLFAFFSPGTGNISFASLINLLEIKLEPQTNLREQAREPIVMTITMNGATPQ